MKALSFLAAFIGGAAVGAAVGILFAPEKGTETRDKIAEALRKRGIKLNRKEMDSGKKRLIFMLFCRESLRF